MASDNASRGHLYERKSCISEWTQSGIGLEDFPALTESAILNGLRCVTDDTLVNDRIAVQRPRNANTNTLDDLTPHPIQLDQT